MLGSENNRIAETVKWSEIWIFFKTTHPFSFYIPMKDTVSEEAVDKVCQRFPVIQIINIVDVIIWLDALVDIIKGTILQE